jgi:hypothetical protein
MIDTDCKSNYILLISDENILSTRTSRKEQHHMYLIIYLWFIVWHTLLKPLQKRKKIIIYNYNMCHDIPVYGVMVIVTPYIHSVHFFLYRFKWCNGYHDNILFFKQVSLSHLLNKKTFFSINIYYYTI